MPGQIAYVVTKAALRFLREHDIRVLNVAGPRASKEPDVASFVMEVLEKAWASP